MRVRKLTQKRIDNEVLHSLTIDKTYKWTKEDWIDLYFTLKAFKKRFLTRKLKADG